MTNYQYLGYLGDVLNTYNDIDESINKFNNAQENYQAALDKMEEYKRVFCLRNCIIGFLVFWVLIMLVTSPILFVPTANAWIWLGFCAILACVIIVASKILYHQQVLPIHKVALQEPISCAKRNGERAYTALLTSRDNLEELCGGLDSRCTCPLSIYIMREAAKAGECANIPQGITYFTTRYKTLEKSTDDDSVKLKESIDREQANAEGLQNYLHSIDDMAQPFFVEEDK